MKSAASSDGTAPAMVTRPSSPCARTTASKRVALGPPPLSNAADGQTSAEQPGQNKETQGVYPFKRSSQNLWVSHFRLSASAVSQIFWLVGWLGGLTYEEGDVGVCVAYVWQGQCH